MNKLTHVDKQGNPAMVDVSAKKVSIRTAKAEARVRLGQEIIDLLQGEEIYTKKRAGLSNSHHCRYSGRKENL